MRARYIVPVLTTPRLIPHARSGDRRFLLDKAAFISWEMDDPRCPLRQWIGSFEIYGVLSIDCVRRSMFGVVLYAQNVDTSRKPFHCKCLGDRKTPQGAWGLVSDGSRVLPVEAESESMELKSINLGPKCSLAVADSVLWISSAGCGSPLKSRRRQAWKGFLKADQSWRL